MITILSWHWLIPWLAVGVAVATDVRSFRIPNWLTYPLLLGGLLYYACGYGLIGFSASALGAAVGFLMLFPLYHVGAMGAGDIKLMAALGAWLRLPATLEVLAVSCLLTAVSSLVMVWRRRFASAGADIALSPGTRADEVSGDARETPRVEAVVQHAGRRGRLIPFAVMIACGLLVVWGRAAWF